MTEGQSLRSDEKNGMNDDSGVLEAVLPSLSGYEAIYSFLDSAAESFDLAVPTIMEVVPFPEDGMIRFQGTGEPDSDIVLFVHSDEEMIQLIHVGSDGFWRYEHFQDDFLLSDGVHEAYVVAIDRGRKLKSMPSREHWFELSGANDFFLDRGFLSGMVPFVIGGLAALSMVSFLIFRRLSGNRGVPRG